MGMRPSRETLASMLRTHGEDDLAERTPSFTDDEMARIGTLGAYYTRSEDAFNLGSGMVARGRSLWRRLTSSRVSA